MTSVQSSPIIVINRPSYFNDITISSGLPYVSNAIAAPAHDSSATSFRIFRSAPRAQRAVVVWWWLSAAHGINMFQSGRWW